MTIPAPAYESADSQAERTALAWSRTLVGLAALLGFMAVHAALGGAATALVVVLGSVAAAVLVLSSRVTRRTWVVATAALAGHRPAARPGAIAVMTVCATLIALASIILVLTDWR
jgi:hypothetical protein